jgi:alginate O-acetyltransferase complex protein AlgI
MVFNSIAFLFFFIVFFIGYWFFFQKNLKLQNLLILLGSYIFYGWADWRLLSFLICISILNFYLGINIEKTENPKYKRLLLNIGLLQGIGGLIFFKYTNFFIISSNEVFQALHLKLQLHSLSLIVPLGISFFTFRTISYLLDIDKGKIKPCKNWVVFFNYVSFFPTVLSGPIDKAITFIPQLEKKRTFDYAQTVDALRQILWGLFKKVVIADGCAIFTNEIFNNYYNLPASAILIGAFLYTIQIYADFSGYSDMAIGVSRLLGFNVTKNFDFPFFAQNIAEFWRKWHISLTAWLTEYVFTPLSITFRNYDKVGLILAILINFTLIGIWHGANWTYVLFGFLHGCYFIPLIISGTMNKKKKIVPNKLFPSLSEFINILATFMLVMLTFIIFKSATISEAYHIFSHLFSLSIFSNPNLQTYSIKLVLIFIFISTMFFIEWRGRNQQFAIARLFADKPKIFRWGFYYLLLIVIFIFASTNQQFIYFQF